MNDAEYLALREEVTRHVAWWQTKLGLGHWEWLMDWRRHPKEGEDDGDDTTLATVWCGPSRLDYTITFYLPSLAGHLDGRNPDDDPDVRQRLIERVVIHELMHVMVWELRPPVLADDDWLHWEGREERVVSQLTLAAVWIANEGRERPRITLRPEGMEEHDDADTGAGLPAL